MAHSESFSQTVYRLKITLDDVKPPVWRRVEVEDCSLETLHEVIQDAMGWENYHLYEFEIDGVRYTDARAAESDDEAGPEDDLEPACPAETGATAIRLRLRRQLEPHAGDRAALPTDPAVHYPRCIEGKRACPPEDCGGPGGYDKLLASPQGPGRRGARRDARLGWRGVRTRRRSTPARSIAAGPGGISAIRDPSRRTRTRSRRGSRASRRKASASRPSRPSPRRTRRNPPPSRPAWAATTLAPAAAGRNTRNAASRRAKAATSRTNDVAQCLWNHRCTQMNTDSFFSLLSASLRLRILAQRRGDAEKKS